ncbi:MAG: CbtA family protein [Burkholderiales bacterium]|nr:CbtA family protein [Burkholderiales bacterium]
MVGSLLLRGMLVGVVAGLLAFGFARLFGEPQVDRAIAFEKRMTQPAGEAPEPETVSRATQAGPGLLTGMVVFGAALGGLFSLAFAYAHGRLGRLGPRATAALLALTGFIALVLVPTLKYPAIPPGVGGPETIGARTGLYFVMLFVSLLAAAASAALARRLWARYGAWNASLMGAAAFAGVVMAAQYALPAVDEVPAQYSADLLWRFRVASLGIHAVLWATIGLGFGALAERRLAGRRPLSARHAL